MVRVLSTALLLLAGCARGPVPSVSEHRVVLESGHIYARRAGGARGLKTLLPDSFGRVGI